MLNFAARRPAPGPSLRALGVVISIGIACASCSARADGMQAAERLLKQHDYKEAMAQVDKLLAAKPGNPQARFLKGVILTESGNRAAAVAVFEKLTKDYPELPEPYNNLAVIYASEGRYEMARAELEKALRTHPAYATAYENLGDVYAKMASEAYDKALQIDSSNSTTQDKLALLRRLTGSPSGSIDEERHVAIASAMRPSASPAKAQPAVRTAAAPPPQPQSAPAAHAAPAAPAPNAAPPASAPAQPAERPAPAKPRLGATQPAPHHAAPAGPAATEHEILATVDAWAKAWSAQDVERYLSFYAKDFQTPHGEARSRWERSRRARLSAPKSILVKIESPRVSLGPPGRARVTFRQIYHTKRLALAATKTLVLERSGGHWLIRREEIAH